MPSFDVVSEVDTQEVRNAVDQAGRELRTRFDFRGVDAGFEFDGAVITVWAPEAFQIRQLTDILHDKLTRRNVDVGVLEEQPMHAAGKTKRQPFGLRQGIGAEPAKRIVKTVKDAKRKAQAQVQGAKVRVTGKKRDELQAIIATLKAEDFGLPLQFNNEIVALEQHEEDEVRRVLLALSSAFRRRAADLRRTLTAATDLDVVQARGAFAASIGGVEPRLAADETCELREARHPLLTSAVTSRLETPPPAGGPAEPVPVDIVMQPPDRALVVTGPNTGGKTVALKTAGLLALMAQAGLHVPAADGSVLPVFRSVFADIGDEQSIAANLSTFSGHLSNIVAMDRRLGLPALILLDEVGAGTDPVEGGALGCAVVEHFRARGAHVIATTHDEVLKSYGATAEGAACAAFGFDPDTFAPTYRLVYGSAGRSLALEIAGRLGLAPEIIAAAADRRSAREAQLAEHLARIDTDRRQLDRLREELEKRERALAARTAEAARRDRELDEREQAGRKRIEQALGERLRTARGEIDAIVGGLRDRVATVEKEAAGRIDSRKRALSTGDSGALRAEAQSALERVARDFEGPAQPAPPPPPAPTLDVEVGAWVTVSPLGVDGAVQSLHGRDADVEVNGKRLRVPLSSLRAAAGRRAAARGAQAQSRVAIHVEEPAGTLDELNVIGCRVDEALSRVEKHLDHAVMSETRTVRFVHGHGTGQLRRSIARFLDTHPCVRRVSAAPPEDGGGAVTIAELKD